MSASAVDSRTCSNRDCGEVATKKFGRGHYCDDHHRELVARSARGKQAVQVAEQVRVTGMGPYETRVMQLVKVAHALDDRLAQRTAAELAASEFEDLYRRMVGSLARAEGLLA